MSETGDGLGMEPRIGEPETSFPGPDLTAGGLSGPTPADMPSTGGPGPTPLQSPVRWVYDFDPASGMARATFNGLVQFTEGGSESAGVTSFNGRTGAVVLEADDLEAAGALANPSPELEGTPTAPTAAPGDSSTTIATTAFVAQAIAASPHVQSFNGRMGAVALTTSDIQTAGGAPAASPALTGTPTAPTGALGDASSQIATDAFVANAIAGGAVTAFNGRRGAVSLTLSDIQTAGGAPVASPNFTGAPSGPTAAPGDATTQLATTAFVTNAVVGATAGVASVNTRTGAVVLNAADLTGMGGAPINSPTFTGNPHAPTPSAGDNSTSLATTAFVATAIAAEPAGVSSFNGRTGVVTLALSDVTNVGGAPLGSPSFTGSPSGPTPTPGDNSTRLATTAFVQSGIAALPAIPGPSTVTPLMDGTAAIGSSGLFARADHVHPTDTTRAPILGVTDGSNAPAGQVGEFVSQTFPATGVASNTVWNIGYLSLPAGDWDISGFAQFSITAAAATQFQAGFSSSGTAFAGGYLTPILYSGASNLGGSAFALPTQRVNAATATTIYFNVLAIFGSGTCNANGRFYARRAR